jgi:hypothetical protein
MAIVSVPAFRQLQVIGIVIRDIMIRDVVTRNMVAMIVILARQGRTDQFAVGEILLFARLLGRN